MIEGGFCHLLTQFNQRQLPENIGGMCERRESRLLKKSGHNHGPILAFIVTVEDFGECRTGQPFASDAVVPLLPLQLKLLLAHWLQRSSNSFCCMVLAD